MSELIFVSSTLIRIEFCKFCISNVFTSSDVFNYVQSKTVENGVYLKCAVIRYGCKVTAKLKTFTFPCVFTQS